MVRLHATRLMRGGEVALWFDGAIVWSGVLGTRVPDLPFDVVSMHIDDGTRMLAMIGDQLSPDIVLNALSGWWD